MVDRHNLHFWMVDGLNSDFWMVDSRLTCIGHICSHPVHYTTHQMAT